MKADESLLLTNQAGQKLLERTVSLLQECSFKLVRDRIVVFVCGGPSKPKDSQNPSWRAAFLEWFSRTGGASRLEMFLAEKAYDVAIHSQHGFLNLGDFEKVLADLSDCVLLFPESAGSHAEAGVFANSTPKLYEKILVANERVPHNSTSFLSRGPLHRFGAKSRFAQAIVLDQERSNNPSFQVIIQRIEENALRNRTAITWTNAREVDLRERLAIALALTRTAGILCQGDLSYLLSALRLPISSPELKQILRILRMFKQVESPIGNVYRYLDDAQFRADIAGTKGSLTALTASYRSYYLEAFPNLFGEMVTEGAG